MLVTSQLPTETTKFATISFQRALVPPPLKKVPPPMEPATVQYVFLWASGGAKLKGRPGQPTL